MILQIIQEAIINSFVYNNQKITRDKAKTINAHKANSYDTYTLLTSHDLVIIHKTKIIFISSY